MFMFDSIQCSCAVMILQCFQPDYPCLSVFNYSYMKLKMLLAVRNGFLSLSRSSMGVILESQVALLLMYKILRL